MEPTGTDFDASVFVDMDAVRSLARASGDDVLMQRAEADNGNAVSAILVNAADGYDPEPILNSINIHIKKVRAIQSKDMISSEASSMEGTSLAVGILTAMICAASLAAQCAVSLLMTGERRRESALLRMMGAPQKKLLRIYLAEGAVLSIAGSLCGILLTAAFSGLAAGLFESGPGQAVIFPGFWQVLTSTVLSLILSAAAGLAGTWIMACRLGAQDAALSLREM